MDQLSSCSLCVVMATYNGSEYISVQMHSICKQLYRTDCLVIVDDASTDQTVFIVDSILALYDINVIFLKNNVNLGPSSTFETAFNNVPSTSDYIVISDQDDIWFDGRLDIIRKNYQHFTSIILNSYLFMGINSQQPLLKDTFSVCPPMYSYLRNLIKPSFIGCHMAFDSSFLKLALPFPPTVYMYDMLIGLCVLLNRDTSLTVDIPTMLYRRHDNVFTPSRTSLVFKLVVRFRYTMTLLLVALRALATKYA